MVSKPYILSPRWANPSRLPGQVWAPRLQRLGPIVRDPRFGSREDEGCPLAVKETIPDRACGRSQIQPLEQLRKSHSLYCSSLTPIARGSQAPISM